MSLNEALDRVLQRVETAAHMNLDGFPHFADQDTGVWTCSRDGDWTGGFWPGILWLAHEATGEERYRALARKWLSRLRSRVRSETVFRCFLFYYGAAIGEILFADRLARQIGISGARGLSKLYNPAARVIPLGGKAEEASSVGMTETNVDGVMSIALLSWAASKTGIRNLQRIGANHAERHIEFCIRRDGSVCQSASFDKNTGKLVRRYTHKGYSDTSTWSRAQAWAMLGYALAAKWAPERSSLLAAGVKVSDWWISCAPNDFVAFWDFDDPSIPRAQRDTSATAIAASSLLKLSTLLAGEEKKRRYISFAENTVTELIEHYLTPTGTEDRRPQGILTSGCYNKKIGLATDHELVWGDYFLLETLLVLSGKLKPEQI